MGLKALLFPNFIINELSRDAHLKRGEELIRLLSLFDEIHCDMKIFNDFYVGFVKQGHEDINITSIIAELVTKGILKDISFTDILVDNVKKHPLPADIDYDKYYNPRLGLAPGLAMMHRIHAKSLVAKSQKELPLESIKSHLIFSLENDFFPLFERPELLLLLTNKMFPENIDIIKEQMKYWELSYFILGCRIHHFSIKSTDELKNFLEVRTHGIKSFQDEMIEMVLQFGGYSVGENEKTKMVTDLINAENELLKIRDPKLFTSIGLDIFTDVASILIGIPLGTIKKFCENIYKNKQLEDNNLQWIVYLQLLKNFQMKTEEFETCALCQISIAEIEAMEDDFFSPTIGKMCIPHMVVYLNVRKAFKAIGKPLLILIKENEKDPRFNLGVPP